MASESVRVAICVLLDVPQRCLVAGFTNATVIQGRIIRVVHVQYFSTDRNEYEHCGGRRSAETRIDQHFLTIIDSTYKLRTTQLSAGNRLSELG